MSQEMPFSTDELVADSEALQAIPREEQLKKLADLAREQFDLETRIGEVETYLSSLKEQRDKISELEIPEIMDELAMVSFKLTNGTKIEVKPYYSAKITDPSAYRWLEQNGEADIIKGEVSIPYPKGFDQEYIKRILQVASSLGLQGTAGEEVHHSTLRAWVKNMIESGQNFPRELFNVFVGKRTKISL